MNFPDSFYIALCMTVLLVGAVYWVWTQIQYVQRKVNVLENIVYELKQVCEGFGKAQSYQTVSTSSPDTVMSGTSTPNSPTRYPSAPSSVIDDEDDILHESLHREVDIESEEPLLLSEMDIPIQEGDSSSDSIMLNQPNSFSVPDETDNQHFFPQVIESVDDLQPGGVGSGEVAEVSSLDTMTVKELRRLAMQRGVVGASDMSKKKLIAAIKATPSDAFTLDAHI